LGRTRDDAAGEAFDKVAKMMGLGYPGGPVVDKLASQGDASLYPFPRAWLPGTWDFSFSGLKTAVLYRLREKKTWPMAAKRNLCAGFQAAVVQVLAGKTAAAARALGLKRVVVGGGVAANSALRARLTDLSKTDGFALFIAPPALCTDNAAMIAAAAFVKSRHGGRSAGSVRRVEANLHIPLETESLPPFQPAVPA
jgi:N6-L-threonylcarbamoyladenine synthase